MFHMSKINRTIPRLKTSITRRYSQPALQDQDEYSDTPEYPPILDLSLKARKQRERQHVYDKIKNINTIEEKQIALNMPRYYGWRSVIFLDDKVPYNAMPMVQGFTRSHFIPSNKLPEIYADTEAAADLVAKDILSLVEDAILLENEGVLHSVKTETVKPEAQQIENAHSKRIVRQINRIITNTLSERAPHILSAQIDYDPRLEAFWFVGGTQVPKSVKKWRRQYKHLRDRIHEPIDRPIQFLGTPQLTIRSNQPLRPILPYSEAENPAFKVPKFELQPESVGYYTEHRHGTNIPGFWPGDRDEFGLLSFHGRGFILDRRESFGPQDNIEAIHCSAIKSSFAWLLAQANYQGFTVYNDLTYPLATQTVITNGQLWSLYAYQLNTIAMHGEHIDENPKHNVCFGTHPLKLYESIENGKVIGLNSDVLRMIIQMYLNAPEERDHDMKPYLNKDEQVVADIEDDKKRCWLEERFKHLVSNKPRHFLEPEVYAWEKIYKIDHNQRFHEAKRRPFELEINPFKRRLNEHLPRYIPKALRPYPKSRKKFETTYYPDV